MPLPDMPLSADFTQIVQPHSWLAQAWFEGQNHGRQPYVGRFAPSPSGLLHQGSLIAALASYVHAHWHHGSWLVRMEDVDFSRCTVAYGQSQLATLHALGFEFDEPVMWQSQRSAAYQQAFDRFAADQRIYPCTCTRRDLGDNSQHNFNICQARLKLGHPIRSWRFRVTDQLIAWRNGTQTMHEDLTKSCGDFVIKREPDEWTYQLAVVVDDGAQGITHIVRGNDLLDSSARQIALQETLSLPRPVYNHIPLLLDEAGRKLSKSEQAPALSTMDGVACLMHAWCFLGGRDFAPASIDEFWRTVLMPRV